MAKVYSKLLWKERKEKQPSGAFSFKQRLRIKEEKKANRLAILNKIKIIKTRKRSFLKERRKKRETKEQGKLKV